MYCNMCKRGYFRRGKISRKCLQKNSQKCLQDLSHGGNFHDATPISLIKSYGFYFRAWEIFVKKTHKNFHVYSISLTFE